MLQVVAWKARLDILPLLGARQPVQQQQQGWKKMVMSEIPGIDTEANLEKEIHLSKEET